MMMSVGDILGFIFLFVSFIFTLMIFIKLTTSKHGEIEG